MAIVKRTTKRKGVSYQVRVRGTDGRWITETFPKRKEAEEFERNILRAKSLGGTISNISNQLTVSEFFGEWEPQTKHDVSPGWRKDKIRYFRQHVEPHIGFIRLNAVRPAHISKILSSMAERKYGEQMRLHVFNLLHRMFRNCVEDFEYLHRSPVKREQKPKVSRKEAPHLSVSDLQKLVRASEGSLIETAVWLQVFLGLRLGEVQALTWSDVNLDNGQVIIRRTYVRKEKRMKDSPKGRKHHIVFMPPELWEFLKRRRWSAQSLYVASVSKDGHLHEQTYYHYLKKLCRRHDIRWVASHGLRHSMTGLYQKCGASRDDLRAHFDHSSGHITDIYLHGHQGRLEEVAKRVRLFESDAREADVPKMFPNSNVIEFRRKNGKEEIRERL